MWIEKRCKYCGKNIKIKIETIMYPIDYFCNENHRKKEQVRFNKLPEGV